LLHCPRHSHHAHTAATASAPATTHVTATSGATTAAAITTTTFAAALAGLLLAALVAFAATQLSIIVDAKVERTAQLVTFDPTATAHCELPGCCSCWTPTAWRLES